MKLPEGYFERTMRAWGKWLDQIFDNFIKVLNSIPEEDIRKALHEKGYEVKDINKVLRQLNKLKVSAHG